MSQGWDVAACDVPAPARAPVTRAPAAATARATLRRRSVLAIVLLFQAGADVPADDAGQHSSRADFSARKSVHRRERAWKGSPLRPPRMARRASTSGTGFDVMLSL